MRISIETPVHCKSLSQIKGVLSTSAEILMKRY